MELKQQADDSGRACADDSGRAGADDSGRAEADDNLLCIQVIGPMTPDHPEDDPLGAQFGESVFSRRILVDLEQASMISSPGIGCLLKWSRKAREAGGRVVFHSVPPMVMQALKIVMVHRVLTLVEDEDAARKLLSDEAA